MSALLRSFVSGRRGRSGSVAVVFAVSAACVVGAGAFAVDVGFAYAQKARLQDAADAAAVAAVPAVDRKAAVRGVLDEFGMRHATFRIAEGDHVPGNDRDERFFVRAGGRAVRVVAEVAEPTFLAGVFGYRTMDMSVVAEAQARPMAMVHVGSRLASADPALLQAVVEPLLGFDARLSVLDYRHLDDARVDLGSVFSVVPGWRDMTIDELMERSVPARKLLDAAGASLSKRGDAAGPVVARIAASLGPGKARADASVNLSRLVEIDGNGVRGQATKPSDVAAFEVDAFDLVKASLLPAPGGKSDRLEAVLALPGVAAVEVEATGLEAAKPVIGDVGARADTAQVRLRATIRTTGVVAALGARIEIPIEVVVAGATAEVVRMSCDADPSKRFVDVAARPGVFRASVGRWSAEIEEAGTGDALPAATIAALPAVKIRASANVSARESKPVMLSFRGSEIESGRPRTVSTRTVASSVVSSLLDQTKLEIEAGPLSLGLPVVEKGVRDAIDGLASQIDRTVGTVLGIAGAKVGEADVWVGGMECGRARLFG